MRRSRFTEEQIIRVLNEGEAGANIEELCQRRGISPTTYYRSRRKYGGLAVPEAQRLKGLKEENRRLKCLVADQVINVQVLQDLPGKRRVTVEKRRLAVIEAWDAAAISERKACRYLGVVRSTIQHRSRRPSNGVLQGHIKELSGQRRQWGYRRLHVLLEREGWEVYHKKVYRIYREERLQVRRRRRKQVSHPPQPTSLPGGPNECWSLNFMIDILVDGHRFRCLILVNDYTRECPALEVDHSLPGARVVDVLEGLAETYGLPSGALVCDNGHEFTGQALDAWAYRNGVTLDFIRPGKPVENCLIESTGGSFRDECFNEHWFTSLADARRRIELWRRDYNKARPHSSLENLNPEECAGECRTTSENWAAVA